MSQENVEAVRGSLEGWNHGDIDAWLGSPHPEIEFRTSGLYPGTDPVYREPAGLRRFWTTFREPWEWIFRFADGLVTRVEGYAAWKEALEAAGLEE